MALCVKEALTKLAALRESSFDLTCRWTPSRTRAGQLGVRPMNTVAVRSVEPYAPGDESATVTLSSASGDIVVFCYPCNLKPGDQVENHLSALDANVQAAYLLDWPEEVKQEKARPRLERIGKHGYRGCARVIDQSSGLVEVFGFHIDLGEVPCDGPVEFECTRIDL